MASVIFCYGFYPAEITRAEKGFKNEAVFPFYNLFLLFSHHPSVLNNPQDGSWRLENAHAFFFPISTVNFT